MAQKYRLKQLPEDFIVREAFRPPVSREGPYSYYMLEKKGLTTQYALDEVSRMFRVDPKFVNCSGSKDKEAVTTQFISVKNGPAKSFSAEGMNVEFLGRGRERINLGSATANSFEIVIRNITKKPRKISRFPNYYDSQRFGVGLKNHLAGKLILKRQFAKAAQLAGARGGAGPVEKLRSLPKGVLRIYPHSYQSWLWNTLAAGYLSGKAHNTIDGGFGKLVFPKGAVKNVMVPVIGYSTILRPPFREAGQKLLEKEGIRRADFKIAELPECNLEGSERELMVEPERLETGPLEKDELNRGKKKCRVSFRLPAGSYATMAVRAMLA